MAKNCGNPAKLYITYGITIINNTTAMKDFIISPNPSNGKFSLSLSNCMEYDFIAYIFTLTGSLVYESSINFANGRNSRQIDLHNLPDGMYFIFLRGKADFFTQKIVVSHQVVEHSY